MTKHSTPIGKPVNQWLYCGVSGEPCEREILDAIVQFTSYNDSNSALKVFRYLTRHETTNIQEDKSMVDSAKKAGEEKWMIDQTPTRRGDVQWYVDIYCQ